MLQQPRMWRTRPQNRHCTRPLGTMWACSPICCWDLDYLQYASQDIADAPTWRPFIRNHFQWTATSLTYSIRHWNRLYYKLPRGNKWRLMEERIHRHAQNPSSFVIFWWNPHPHQPLGISCWRNPEAMHWDQTEVMHQQWKVHILTTHITGLEDILDDSGHEDYLGSVVLQANHDISIHNMHTSCRSNPLAFQSTVNHSEDKRNSTQPIFL